MEPAPAAASTREERRERVAVIAVHGVGKHEPGASAQGMADLLLGINAFTHPEQGSPYHDFSCENIEIPLPGPEVFKPKEGVKKSDSVFEERRGYFAGQFTPSRWRDERQKRLQVEKAGSPGPDAAKQPAEPDINDEFAVTQLGDYEGDKLVGKYETVRLRGARRGASGEAPNVDIYEMYWADLAKRNNSFIRFFMSFYQLLIHLASLGRTAVDHAALEHGGSIPWLLAQKSCNYASRVLTLGLFNLLVLLPVVAFAPITRALPSDLRPTVAAALLALGATGAIVWLFSRVFMQGRKSPAAFLAFGAIILITAGGIFFGAKDLFANRNSTGYVLDFAWWLVAFAICSFIFAKYDQVRAGAKRVGQWMLAIVAGGFIGSLIYALKVAPTHAYDAAAFVMVQYIFLALRVLWFSLVGLAVFGWMVELRCLRSVAASSDNQRSGKRARAKAAFRTGRFALAVPTLLLLLLTMFFWNGVFHYSWKTFPIYKTGTALPQAPLPPFLSDALAVKCQELPRLLDSKEAIQCDAGAQDPTSASNEMQLESLLLQSAPVGLPFILVLVTIGFLLLALLAVPSAIQEEAHPQSATNIASRKLGAWLSGGFAGFPAAIWSFWLAAFGFPAAYMLVVGIHYLMHQHSGESWIFHLYRFALPEFTVRLTLESGPKVAAVAVFIATAGKAIFKSASTILDTVLDVDNYLRTGPAHRTPRARVVERYVGLLRHVNSRGYDRVVIVAHSLGSLISADLLRFLNGRRIPALSDFAFAGDQGMCPRIRLFTMGSPLRQLLNRFFPNLYMYIRPVPDDAGEASPVAVPVPAKGTQQIIPVEASPDPEELGIEIWANYYRSGDYVGRSLWLDEWMDRTRGGDNAGAFPHPEAADSFTDANSSRAEACIGLGAHTHYWDRSAPDIGEFLDSLITGRSAERKDLGATAG